MKIDRTSTPVWQELALRNPSISKIVFPAYIARIARLDSMSPVEVSAYYDGVISEDAYYVTAINRLCWGKSSPIDDPGRRNVGIHPDRGHAWVFDEEVVRSFARKQPGVATVLCHNHPKTGVQDLKDICLDEANTYLSILDEERLSGEYDYLVCGGKPTLDEVVNEVISRLLSRSDIELTPGCAHVLITDTYLPNKPLSVFNGYQIVEETRAVGKLPIELLHQQSKTNRAWYREIVTARSESFSEISVRHETICNQLSEDEQLMPNKIPFETFFTEA